MPAVVRYGEMKPSVIASKKSTAAVVDASAKGLAKSDKGVPSHVIPDADVRGRLRPQ
jgi:hypothetical protein